MAQPAKSATCQQQEESDEDSDDNSFANRHYDRPENFPHESICCVLILRRRSIESGTLDDVVSLVERFGYVKTNRFPNHPGALRSHKALIEGKLVRE